MTHNHGLLVDLGMAQQHKRELLEKGYIGVRVVPVRLGFLVRSNGLATEWDERKVSEVER